MVCGFGIAPYTFAWDGFGFGFDAWEREEGKGLAKGERFPSPCWHWWPLR